MTTGERLKELREARKMSQEEIADILGVKRQIISYYETDTRRPNVNDLIKLAQTFETTVDYLLGLSDVKTTETNLKAICEYTGLSETTIDHLRTNHTAARIVNVIVENSACENWSIWNQERGILPFIADILENNAPVESVIDGTIINLREYRDHAWGSKLTELLVELRESGDYQSEANNG